VLVYRVVLDFLSLPFLISSYQVFIYSLYSLYHVKYTCFSKSLFTPVLESRSSGKYRASVPE
jgi:hypothetical protein